MAYAVEKVSEKSHDALKRAAHALKAIR